MIASEARENGRLATVGAAFGVQSGAEVVYGSEVWRGVLYMRAVHYDCADAAPVAVGVLPPELQLSYSLGHNSRASGRIIYNPSRFCKLDVF
jgi:hypothetical protein